MSPRDSDTGVNRNSIMCMISQERQNVFTLQVSTQEATSCPAFFFFFFPSPIISPSLHHLLPSISSLHLPDSRSSSSVCRRSHLFSPDMAFYLRSNSHHFNRDKITLRWAAVPAGPPRRAFVCVCFLCLSVCVCGTTILCLWLGRVYLDMAVFVFCLHLSIWPSVDVCVTVHSQFCVIITLCFPLYPPFSFCIDKCTCHANRKNRLNWKGAGNEYLPPILFL